MKTRTMVVLGIAVAIAVGLSLPLASAYSGGSGGLQGFIGGMMGRNTPQPSYQSMMGNGYSYGGGMMSQGGMMSSYGSMMGSGANYAAWCYQNMKNFSSSVGDLVMISGYSFYPSSLTVARGTTVTWINMDFVVHTVTSGTEQNHTNLFDSYELSHMQSFSYTFTTPGVYQYYCDIHPGMVGTITVT
ncbi:MAG: plastocyanin/azurin family copper-binding protein [Thaumarchaeota archaeon]|nr:plastocyanin/azurin family copper-binding protein [Nitrososphaerota archaeon]